MSDATQIFSEFLGTAILVLLGDGVCAAVNLKKSKAEASGWIVIATGWATAVTIAVYASGFMGPAHLNPAVTLGMAMTGNFSWGLAVPFMLAQLAGGIVGAILVWLNYLPLWDETEDQGAANTMTEVIGTFVLVFGLLAFGANTFTDGLNPIVVGILILAIGLSLGGPTGYAINPARDLGPRIAHQILPIKNKGTSDWGYAFVPIIGPFIGAALAAGLFMILPL